MGRGASTVRLSRLDLTAAERRERTRAEGRAEQWSGEDFPQERRAGVAAPRREDAGTRAAWSGAERTHERFKKKKKKSASKRTPEGIEG